MKSIKLFASICLMSAFTFMSGLAVSNAVYATECHKEKPAVHADCDCKDDCKSDKDCHCDKDTHDAHDSHDNSHNDHH